VGVTRSAGLQFERYGNLQTLQRSRLESRAFSRIRVWGDVDVPTRLVHSLQFQWECCICCLLLSLADNFVATEHHLAGNGHMVGIVSTAGVGIVVFSQI